MTAARLPAMALAILAAGALACGLDGLEEVDEPTVAVPAGDPDAQVVMGVAYRDGSDGPPQDFARAATWFALAAEQGHPMAQYNMGSLYEDGRGVPKDLVLAHMWFNLAAAAFPWPGDMRSQAFLRGDRVAERLTAAQLREAQERATAWWEQREAASAGTEP